MKMTAARVAAFAIALVAVADPALTSARSSRPMVAILTSDPARDDALAGRVSRELSRHFAVVRGWIGTAAGTVLVGSTVPDDAPPLDVPLVAVVPARTTPALRIVSVEAPASPSVNTRVPVEITISVAGAAGQHVDVALLKDGVVLDRTSLHVVSDTATPRPTLTYVPAVPGTASLGVRAFVPGTAAEDRATAVVRATEARFAVLFFDPRASWASTFVRRALEADPRFAVSHRVLTSRGVSNTGGVAPTSLRDPDLLAAYETVVVGAPEVLTDADVTGLEGFMRARGGRVVLLMDGPSASPVDRLTGAGTWRGVRLPAPAPLDDRSGHGGLRIQEIAWPAVVPSGTLIHSVGVGRDSSRRAVIWSTSVGAGRVLVSGALDAWHFRDPATSRFDAFWTNAIAELSASAPRAVTVEPSRNVLRPGESSVVRVKVREALLANRAARSASVSAYLVGENDSTFVRLWPTATPGTFAGTVTAPRRPAFYRLIASTGVATAEVPIVVDSQARIAVTNDEDVVTAFVSSRGGLVVDESDLSDLPARVAATLQPVSRVETRHPMRSAWWIAPFALLLGAEWWWRRRRGES